MSKQYQALKVIAETYHIRNYLMLWDPKALEQVDMAITEHEQPAATSEEDTLA